MADYNALAIALIEAKADKAKAEARLKEANKRIEEAERTLWTAFVDNEVDGMRVEGFPFSPDLKEYYTIPAENRDAVHEVMVELGLGDIYQETVNARTFEAAMRDLAERNGGELPEALAELVSVFGKEKINGPGYDKCVAWVESHPRT